MFLKRMFLLLPAGLILLSSTSGLAQPEPGMEGEMPESAPMPVEPPSIEPEPSVEPEITPDSNAETNIPQNVGGAGPDGPLSLVQCGPSSAAFVVTKVPVGCHVLKVNSPPGQAENAEEL